MRLHPAPGDQKGQDAQPEGSPCPAVEALENFLQSTPRSESDQEKQADQDRALNADAFLAFAGVKGNNPEQKSLKTLQPGYGQSHPDIRIGQETDLERPG